MSVCSNQDNFNQAYRKAVDSYDDLEYKSLSSNQKVVMGILISLQIIFIIWGVILAIKYIPGPQRPLHLVFAMTTGPVYVLAFYLSLMGGKMKDKK